MLSSPLRWVGGKSRLRAEVIARFPCDTQCYAEVFAGAAWVLFGKEPHSTEVINDVNGDLVNLWRVLKWRPAELLETVEQSLYSREVFDELRSDPAPPSHAKDVMQRALPTYLLIQMAFGAEVSSVSSASFGYGKGKGHRLFACRARDHFPPAADRLQNVYIENLDFVDLIRRYDQPRTLFFCDPPYLGTRGYASEFTETDHERLASVLHRIQGRFLVTINDHPRIRELYADCHIEEAVEARSLARALTARKAAPILFISNYDTGSGRERESNNARTTIENRGNGARPPA